MLITQFLDQPEPMPGTARAPLEQLTEREREIVALAGEGLSNDEIAGRLFVSPFTVKTYISRAMTKLGARDRAQLVMIAFRTGLVAPRGAS